MSQSSIARWNAIPMSREDDLKRKRQEDDMVEDDDEDDDVSLVSRSPSPVNEAMDIDPEGDISKYDEYIRKPIRETITVDTKIKPSNKGFALLAKMGWSEGQPLGLSGDGRVDPIPFEIKQDTLGIGRATQENLMIEEAVSNRRELHSERQTKETDEQRRVREHAVARKAAVQDEISSTLRAFHCIICDKQFQNVAQYDEHTNSYAHHHRARAKDMQANARIKPQEEIDKRKEKERKREEKELRKIAAAAGIKMPKASGVATSAAITSEVPPPSMDLETSSSSQTGEGWASASTSSGFKKSGWATVGTTASTSPQPQPPPVLELPSSSSSGWAPISDAAPPNVSANPSSTSSHIPSFRTGGWTSLDTGTTVPVPVQPPPPPSEPMVPPPPPSLSSRSAQPVIGATTNRGGWMSIPASSNVTSTTLPPPLYQYEAPSGPASVQPVPPPTPPSRPAISKIEEPKRSGWQKFQAKNVKRK